MEGLTQRALSRMQVAAPWVQAGHAVARHTRDTRGSRWPGRAAPSRARPPFPTLVMRRRTKSRTRSLLSTGAPRRWDLGTARHPLLTLSSPAPRSGRGMRHRQAGTLTRSRTKQGPTQNRVDLIGRLRAHQPWQYPPATTPQSVSGLPLPSPPRRLLPLRKPCLRNPPRARRARFAGS